MQEGVLQKHYILVIICICLLGLAGVSNVIRKGAGL